VTANIRTCLWRIADFCGQPAIRQTHTFNLAFDGFNQFEWAIISRSTARSSCVGQAMVDVRSGCQDPYEADGQTRNDFPLLFNLFWMILDFGLVAGCMIVPMMIRIRDRRTRELESAVERGERLLRDSDHPAG
jgi:hypothetical protein